MREKRLYVILTFATTTAAMAMEKNCIEKGIPGRLIPVPREITAGCGLAWRMLPDEYEIYRELLEAPERNVEACTRLKL